MKNGWRERLFAAIDADPRTDRAISLEAGFGPNFIGQMRGSKSTAGKKPNIEYVRRLAAVLGKELSTIIGPNGEDSEQQLRNALLAYGVDTGDLPAVMKAISGFVSEDADAGQPGSSQPRGQSERASRLRVKEPSR